MRVALMIEGQEGVSWEDWLALARVCEESGIESLFRSDHYQSVFQDPTHTALDAWATTSALSAVTERLRLGTLVSPVTFRRAGELAKVVATADHVSGGRVELGLGAGWNEREHETFGFPFPDLRERMDELEQQLGHVRRQWAELSPRPVQQPGPPVIVGGTAGPRGCRLGARYADEYNTVFASVEDCAERK
ncbi:MAG TPA: LLM class flavin-dependent oxidoreductase, partial [Gaiellaceae bacterium]|nr:LLM class flavin-dependent oxidoreductase [Gaiellaceae bacterium]